MAPWVDRRVRNASDVAAGAAAAANVKYLVHFAAFLVFGCVDKPFQVEAACGRGARVSVFALHVRRNPKWDFSYCVTVGRDDVTSRTTTRIALCLAVAFLSGLARQPASAQKNLAGAVRNRLALDRLCFVGNVLMIGAHPDDENTGLLAYLARGRMARAAYLSATRGEGGQNLIGPEQGDLLGLIRTQELLAARRIDGAEQFFTRAIDFGFSKTAEETMAKWDRQAVLSDMVWTIRRFRPDVIVIQHSGTPADGHGNHQAVGILGREAFAAAADRNKFPEQLRWVDPWQAKRLMGRGAGSGVSSSVSVDTGEFDPLLGFSFSEIAGMSRSMHRSQGMGAPEQRGGARSSLANVAGDPATKDIFDGIDTTWNRLPGGAEVGRILDEAVRAFQPEQPEQTIPLLLKARPLIAAIKDPRASLKLKDLDETIVLCAGLWLDASADRTAVVPGDALQVSLEAINRSQSPMVLENVKLEGVTGAPALDFGSSSLAYNEPQRRSVKVMIPADQPYSQPYWLQHPSRGETYVVDNQELIGLPESPALLRAHFIIRAGTEELDIVRPVIRRYVDRLEGETSRAVVVVPPVAVGISQPVLLFPDIKAKTVEVRLHGNVAGVSGELRMEAPGGFRVQPASVPFRIQDTDEETVISFTVTGSTTPAAGELRAVARVNGKDIANDMRVISYSGIPPQTVFPEASAKAVRADIATLARKIGYIMGAGDEVPDALRQLGCEVTLLGADDLTGGDLGRFDAIVAGVRSYNVRADLRANQKRLMDYVAQGGTYIVQYNVADRRGPSTLQAIGPFPLEVGSARVSVEEAPVVFLHPDDPLLATPNKITQDDFRDWIQERGLNFASQWDPKYTALFESHDPNEPPQQGITLCARVGKGAYIFTAFSWFRELPAGVPGAFKIFANFLSASKTVR